jgi:dsDNA-specific endonuclease/ATPase MutS2
MLNIALSIAFCLSLHTVAMEPIEQPIGGADTSIEPDIEVNHETKETLKKQIKWLQTFYRQFDLDAFHPKLYQKADRLQTKMEKVLQKTYEMYFGIIPANTELIGQRMNEIEEEYLSFFQ